MRAAAARGVLRSIGLSAAAAIVTALLVLLCSYWLFPVTGVKVSGAQMFPESTIHDAVPENASLLTLNSRMLEHRAKSNPWVKTVEVRKHWRSGIVAVEVEERRPILDATVGGRRVILAVDGTELPGLGHADLNRVELDRGQVQEILKAARTLERNGLRFGSVDSVGPGGVEATVEGRRVIFAGKVGEKQARALEGIMASHPDAPLFDLRSPDRVVVGDEPDVALKG